MWRRSLGVFARSRAALWCGHRSASSYSWAPQCAIGAAERDDIERAARQTLRVLEKEAALFGQASLEDEAEARPMVPCPERSYEPAARSSGGGWHDTRGRSRHRMGVSEGGDMAHPGPA